jgi:hypothetical protein
MKILSLGAGVQSTTLLLMACEGELKVDRAIFADTQNEPVKVYDHLQWLTGQATKVGIPVDIVTAGSLGDSILDTEKRSSSIPLFVKTINQMTWQQREELKRLRSIDLAAAADGDEDLLDELERDLQRLEAIEARDGTAKVGMVFRQCTRDYKVRPVRRRARELSGGKPVEMLMGISTDEALRQRTSDVKWITNVYPLLERGMSRDDCLRWVRDRGYPEPPKSACYFCPYASNQRWREIRDNDPDSWAKAVAFDAAIRNSPKFAGEAYLHRSALPLDLAPIGNPSPDDNGKDFEQECIGMCGN